VIFNYFPFDIEKIFFVNTMEIKMCYFLSLFVHVGAISGGFLSFFAHLFFLYLLFLITLNSRGYPSLVFDLLKVSFAPKTLSAQFY